VAEDPDPDLNAIAETLRESVGLLLRRLRQMPALGELTLPESAALTRLDRGGPTTASALARLERISPQSIGATLAALEARGLVERHSDPGDGRRVVLSITAAGRQLVNDRRGARSELIAAALRDGFTATERDLLLAAAPLLERLAERL